ncbi:DUF2000 domain-containing protein [Cellulomonas pakistanensis]|uniref:DUF2000 domain-containing protein n=1 Tax=Cellulomonas pakistanensis TaxID=992287 RepID=A0A919PH62_9CELL|nr:DUF2000 domain-containing protein [Cellulomonas pakistanensis]GIG38087.1 hypothetical protein Cpa01nite_34680 [Cellulomonas pakistanensis]
MPAFPAAPVAPDATTTATPVSAPSPAIGFDPEEIRLDEPTRSARLKWVVVVDETLPPGRAANAVACVTAATTSGVAGLLGPATTDADGDAHTGLPWIGCTVLGAPRDVLAALRARAAASPGMHVADMPAVAQEIRVYTEYVDAMAGRPGDALDYLAVSLVGPKNRVDRLVGKLRLLA